MAITYSEKYYTWIYKGNGKNCQIYTFAFAYVLENSIADTNFKLILKTGNVFYYLHENTLDTIE